MQNFYKHLLVFCFVAAAGGVLQANAQLILNRQVTASTGSSGTLGGSIFQYTLGEPLISTIAGGSLMFTQGFMQPEEVEPQPAGVTSILNVLIYPNPAVTNTKIQFDLTSNAVVTTLIINAAGQLVFQDIRQCGAGKVLIITPVNHFGAGVYTVVVRVAGKVVQEKLVVQ